MKQARIRLYTTWLIFGFIASYALEQLFKLLTETTVYVAVALDMNPTLIKYSKAGIKGLLIILIILLTVNLVGNKESADSDNVTLPAKKPFMLVLIAGLFAAGLQQVVYVSRTEIMAEYMERHQFQSLDFYEGYYHASMIPNGIIFTALVLVYFILTSKK